MPHLLPIVIVPNSDPATPRTHLKATVAPDTVYSLAKLARVVCWTVGVDVAPIVPAAAGPGRVVYVLFHANNAARTMCSDVFNQFVTSDAGGRLYTPTNSSPIRGMMIYLGQDA